MQRRVLLVVLAGLVLSTHSFAQEDFESLVEEAKQAYEGGNLEEAEELYREAISLDDENAALYYNLGNLYYDMERFGEA
ncbi:MAG: tetratricopeptide repeat protein, partial [Alkalispirochaetaceae bacterium]